MSVLLDTNILLRIVQPASAHHATATSAVYALQAAGELLCIVPQVLYEFWVTATRPIAANGLGMDVAAAERSVGEIIEDFQLFKDERGIFSHWRTLVVDHAVKGKVAHDTRLVAAMQRHGIATLLTFNTADFRRFPSIQVLAPSDVVAGASP